ncbi:hypothetical protein GKQ23_10270 [Erwinia sp. E602]|uniref:hypothetical protein n=1 Tax=Erwinia sp. E602 TaxID=2675378 RepID=UPI001BA5AC41|nr:hypothetical protein [Erwinia sp. E602]QUG75344.1 hypothetical protein GKQ23_10270 [Erwinia sp. E602]
MKFTRHLASSVSCIALTLCLTSCLTIRQGTPRPGGVIDMMETQHRDSTRYVHEHGGEVTLHTSPVHFMELKEYCVKIGGQYEQLSSLAGWCMSPQNIPLFIIGYDRYDYDVGTFSVSEKGTGVSDAWWLKYTKETYSSFWNLHNEQ